MNDFDNLVAELKGMETAAVDMTKAMMPGETGKQEAKNGDKQEAKLAPGAADAGGDKAADKGGAATDDAAAAGPAKKPAAAADLADNDGDGEGGEGGEADGETFGKSFSVTMEDGSTVEAFDGTEMLKSLMIENKGLRAVSEGVMAVLRSMRAQGEAQGAMIKSLQTDITRIGAQGTGRRTMLTINEKPAGQDDASAKPAQVSPQVFMAKAMELYAADKLTGEDIRRTEARIARAEPPPENVRSVVAAALAG